MSEVCPCSAPKETHSPDLHYLRTFTPAELRAHDDRIRADVLAPVLALADEWRHELLTGAVHSPRDLGFAQGVEAALDQLAAALRAAAGTPTHHTTEED